MKKIFLIALPIVILAIAGYYFYSYLQTQHTVSLTFKQEGMSVVLFRGDDETEHELKGIKIKKITKSETINLTDGLYYVIPEEDKFLADPIIFKVSGKDMSVDIDPEYSTAYLKQLLAPQHDEINQTIQQKYSTIINGYTIQEGRLYKKGTWYGTILSKNVSDENAADYYRIVLHKENDTWKVVGDAALILTKAEYPSVPSEVLTSINELNEFYQDKR